QFLNPVKSLCGRIEALNKGGDVAQLSSVAEQLEQAIVRLNNEIVRELSENVKGDLATTLAVAVSMTGGSSKDAIEAAASASSPDRKGLKGTQTLLEVRASSKPAPLTTQDLESVFQKNSSARFLAAFCKTLPDFMKWEFEEPCRVFSDAEYGPADLWFCST